MTVAGAFLFGNGSGRLDIRGREALHIRRVSKMEGEDLIPKTRRVYN